MSKKRRLILLTFLLVGNLAHTEDRTRISNDSAKDLRALLNPINSLTGRFVQYEFNEEHEQQRTLNGRFAFARSLNMFWEIAPPYAQTLISNGKEVYIYDKDLNQVIIYPLKKDKLPLFFLLEGNEEILARMNIVQPDDKTPVFFLTEINSSQPNEIFIHFENDLPHEMHWTNPFGQRVIYIFSELKRDTKINKNLFRFRIPKGAEIIRETE